MSHPAGAHLLVVDDEAQILELLDLTLSMQGFTVTCAASGPEALERCRAQRFDVIVMDVLMSPWDGFESVRALHRELGAATPPVVFLSGLSRREPLPELGEHVRAEYLVKPFRPSQLVERIVSVLGTS
ncbi:response regulator [Deinococcus hohokamensis]|uniref:Response regulator n=1 Tax=Deinococcus hohokamensis TaxID=309883 RepID=A0ABV9I4Y3_9DEIO